MKEQSDGGKEKGVLRRLIFECSLCARHCVNHSVAGWCYSSFTASRRVGTSIRLEETREVARVEETVGEKGRLSPEPTASAEGCAAPGAKSSLASLFNDKHTDSVH